MLCSGIYDKHKDICEVDQLGFVDVVKAFSQGVIEGATSLDDAKFNNIKEPEAVLGRPYDIFDAIQMSRTIQDYTPPSNDPAPEE